MSDVQLELLQILRIASALYQGPTETELLAEMPWPITVLHGPTFDLAFRNTAYVTELGATDCSTWRHMCAEALRSGEPQHAPELPYRTIVASGPREGFISIAVGRIVHGDTPGVLLVGRDVTQDVITRELRASAEELRWSGVARDTSDYQGPRWRTYVGDDRARWIEVVHDEDRARCLAAIEEAQASDVPQELELRLQRADGAYRWHRARFARHGDAGRWFACALDIDEARHSELVRAEALAREQLARAEAEDANRLKDQFLATVSHELRAPLTTLLLWERVLREEIDNPTMRAKALEAIRQSAQAQSRLVGDLLDVSRAISGKLHVDLRSLDLGRLLGNVLDKVAPRAEAKSITVVRRIEAGPRGVVGDASRLEQVFENLVSNAVKFTDHGGKIVVETRVTDRDVVIAVRDTGRGITPSFLPRVFEPFSQAEGAFTRIEGGLGLGLAIAKQLVDLHYGSISAASEGPGQGATFTVTLPLTRSRRAATPTPPAARGALQLHDVHVLVVDDDARIRDALSMFLTRAGARVRTAGSVAAAHTAIAHEPPDVVVCDIAMPGEDGYAFVRGVRATGSIVADLVVIALTAHASPDDAQRVIAAGFDLHLAKPVRPEQLIASINEVLASQRTERESKLHEIP